MNALDHYRGHEDEQDDPRDPFSLDAHERRQAGQFVCVYCGGSVELDAAWRRVHGWVRAVGGDGFKRDGADEEFAHKACIEIDKTVGRNQEAFDV